MYFIRDPKDGQIKIGQSLNPQMRLKQVLKRAEMLGYIIDERDGDLEYELHDRFKKYRVRGEWFLPSKEILDYIMEHVEKGSADDETRI